ncbi:MAG TPA: alpha-isopropylmalate synthase regulatory domain-containing protein [Oligoflexia bacterium]|nr:alpha-isopropylmalate synthase regulatory domain-containing protein [Oligoflexia bacterium]
MDENRHVRIFDTTLRDGQQCPGAGMSFRNNLEYAKLVQALRFDVVEAGFPSASKVDFDIVKAVSELYATSPDSPRVAGLCQLRDEQIDRTIEALLPAVAVRKAYLHTYVPVAPKLMEASLGEKADKGKIAKNVFDFIKRAVDAGMEVEFSPEGYSRMDGNFDFTADLIRAAVEAGALVINCPDTIGGSCHLEGEEYFVHKMNRHAEIIAREFPGRRVIWSVHCHNDFGLAVQNSINGVFQGPARQIEGCINGIGERAGNAALEQVIMIIRSFARQVDSEKPLYTNVDVSRLQEACDFVSRHMLARQPHWPISGDNAARHSAGGHTNAVLKDPLAYQSFDPREIGKEISFLFGPLSGGNHAKAIIERAGYICSDAEKAPIAQFIKDFYKDRRKGITDEELLRGYFEYRKPVRIRSYNYSRSANRSAIHIEGKFFEFNGLVEEEHTGRDSALAALKKAVDKYFVVDIQSHKSESDRAGIDAKSVSTIVVTDKDKNVFEGVGRDQDIEISAMKALISAVNKAFIDRHYRAKQSQLRTKKE